MLQVVSPEEFLDLQQKYNNLLSRIEALEKKNSPRSKWLVQDEFKEKYGIKSNKTLLKYRTELMENGKPRIKAEKRGRFWYYDEESYLPKK